METVAREFIFSNLEDLESRIYFDGIKNLLEKRALLNSSKIQAISSKELCLFEEVAKMDSPDFSVFIEILRDTGHVILAEWLVNEEKCSKQYYKMNSNPLGYCVIINNIDFMTQNKELFEKRIGSDEDAENLCTMFETIGYKVIQHRNLSAEQIKDEIIKFARLDHSLLDSSIVCVLTHGVHFGGKDYLLGSDGNLIAKEVIYDVFSNKNCESLRNKPKMFFFHACRKEFNLHCKNAVLVNIRHKKSAMYYSDDKEFEIKGKSFMRTKKSVPIEILDFCEEKKKKQPEFSDVFVVHSTCPGEHSVEKIQLGLPSSFCQLIVKTFTENYKFHDLDTLLNLVSCEYSNTLHVECVKKYGHFEKISPYGLIHFYRRW